MNSIIEIPFITAAAYPKRVSHRSHEGKEFVEKTYAEFVRFIRILTAGFDMYGLKKGEHVGFFVNNRYEWISTDIALMTLGCISVPRGSDTAPKEVQFIFHHSDSEYLVLETTKQLLDLIPEFTEQDWERCKRIFIIDESMGEEIPENLKDLVTYYSDMVNKGEKAYKQDPDLVERLSASVSPEDLLTIVYTSGTTGNPKGVMLTHANFMQNVVANTPRLEIDPKKGETTVVMLPSWHVYERAFEYCALLSGLTFVYSSAGKFAADLVSQRPQILISVPRVWESIYQKMILAISKMPAVKRNLVFLFIKINQMYLSSQQYVRGCYISLRKRFFLRKAIVWKFHLIRLILLFPGHKMAGVLFKPFREKVGGRLRGATSAAGTLPKYLDEIFNAIGIPLVNAYGMTECAPGILSRTFGRNTFGTTGVPFDNTEVELRREDGTITSIGEKGVLFARGPQVMQGYYKNPKATKAVLDDEGWMNTGDLAIRSENGEIIIVGRIKDTIVLMGGENVEPEPIEEKMKESLYIDHVAVVGQDRKQLSAIIALNEERLMQLAQDLKLAPVPVLVDGKFSIEHDRITEILMKEVNALLTKAHGFRPFEKIAKILPVKNDFSIGKELTQTLKIKRQYISERFKELIDRLQNDDQNRRNKR
ncbi:MAG: AMP-binding protein [Bacteroidetes bacterium]|nr:AMP-binding protein [Bacteroidota bacterium]